MRTSRPVRRALPKTILAVLLPALWLAAPAPAGAAVPDDTLERIERHVRNGLEDNLVPGAALAVVDVRGRGALELDSFGEASEGRRVTNHTPFVLASVSKVFTAVAVMQLAERDRVGLDAPLRRYLPWFDVVPDADARKVTVRSLLEQTSGIGTEVGGPELRYAEDVTIATAAQRLAGTELEGEPGEEFRYSNANYVLLGALVEEVSGSSYGSYLQRNVLRPLRMQRSFVDLDAGREAGLADGHRYWFGWTRPHTSWTEALLPAGGVISTAPDMARFMRMLLRGGRGPQGRVLSSDSVEEMKELAVEAEVGSWAQTSDAGYGLGLYVGGAPFGTELVTRFHPGGSPDFGSLMALLPDEGVGLTLLLNATPEIDLPGASGAVDRIGAGAVSILAGEEPAAGPTMKGYYRIFDAAAILAVVIALAALIRGLRRPRGEGGGTVVLTALVMLGGGAVLLGLPFAGVGWGVLFLSVPDLALVLLVVGILLLASGAVRLLRLRPRRRRGLELRDWGSTRGPGA
jgi:CubicO group peptidase (beta-lactamase class C family)